MDYDMMEHLMIKYGWCKQEAYEYLAFEPYDPIDWENTQWEAIE